MIDILASIVWNTSKHREVYYSLFNELNRNLKLLIKKLKVTFNEKLIVYFLLAFSSTTVFLESTLSEH